jgi:carboxymethylenebutenolidase
MLNSARFLKAHALSSGKLGVTGFCWGGGTTNWLATDDGRRHAGRRAVLRRGGRTRPASVPETDIKAPLLIHYAENDPRINAMWPAFEAALKAPACPTSAHVYPGTQHGFHNNSTPRYNEAAAKLEQCLGAHRIAHLRSRSTCGDRTASPSTRSRRAT